MSRSISLIPGREAKSTKSVKQVASDIVAQSTKFVGKGSVCSKCGLRENTFVPADDVGQPKFLVVGEAPGFTEAQELKPFVGRTGQPLRAILNSLGYGYRVINTANCLPLDSKTNKLRAPSPKEVSLCTSIFLNKQIKKFDVVLLVGGVALNAVFGENADGDKDLSITKVRGSVILKDGVKYIPVYHPSYIMRIVGDCSDPLSHPSKLVQDWVSDIKRVTDVLQNKPLPFQVESVTEKNVDEVILQIKKQEKIVVDVEGSSLDTLNCQLYSTAISGLSGPVYVVQDLALLKKIYPALIGKDLIMHNATYDYEVLAGKGFLFEENRIYDTMLMAGVIDGTRRFSGYGLKELVRKYLGYKYWRLIANLNDIKAFSETEVKEYNGEDVYATRELFNFFWNTLLTERQVEFIEEVLSPAVKVVAEMEMNGILIDDEVVKKALEQCNTIMAEVGNRMKELAPIDDLNLDSSAAVAKILEQMVAEQIAGGATDLAPTLNKYRTKTGRLSTNKDHLPEMATALDRVFQNSGVVAAKKIADWIRDLGTYRKYSKLKSAFLDNFIEKVHADKRIRAHFNMLGTRTGRLSSNDPNIQQIPGHLRNVFIPRSGYKFIDADLSQVEIRVAGILANELTVKEAYNRKMDIHSLTASEISGVSYDRLIKGSENVHPKASELRQGAKAGNFGLLYGMREAGFMAYAKNNYGVEMTFDEAQRFRNGWFRKYSGFGRWHDKTREDMRRHSYIESPFGRCYSFEPAREDRELEAITRQALNYPVQGTASDLNLYIMGQLFEWKVKEKKEVYFCATVHDSKLLEVREDLVPEVIQKLEEITKGIPLRFPWVTIEIVDEAKVKNNWQG